MKICCLSDLHGHLPIVPDCDLLILGGDYCPTTKGQIFWYSNVFANWLENTSKRMKIIGVAGNHDLLFEAKPDLIPKMNWEYLQDSGTEFGGFKIWGSPWQLRFYDWAFNASEAELAIKWSLIPSDTDIIVLHGPPLGYGDFSIYGNEHCGSPSLLKRIQEIRPKLVVYGHIHGGHGVYKIDTFDYDKEDSKESILVYAAYVNEKYMPVNKPIIIDLENVKVE